MPAAGPPAALPLNLPQPREVRAQAHRGPLENAVWNARELEQPGLLVPPRARGGPAHDWAG